MENLKGGYTKTEIGIIPEDWEVVRLDNILKESKIIAKEPDLNKRITVRLNLKGVVKREINTVVEKEGATVHYVRKAGQFIYGKQNLHKGALGIIPKELDGYQSSSDIPSFDFKEGVCGMWFYYYMAQPWYYKNLEKIAKGTGSKRIHPKDLLNLKIPLPPLPEQEKIAQILSTWDNAIEKLEELINKKIEYKKGLMEKLLSGELRFPEFKEEWEEVKLGGIFNERNERNCEDLELLAVSLNKGVVKRNEIDIKDNSSSDKSKYKRVLPNDIVYNTMRMWQGASGVSKYEGIVSPAYTVIYLKEKNYDINFFGYLFKLPKIIFKFYRYSQGLTSDTWNLKYVNFSKITVKIPTNPKEQKKIAEILTLQDKEIELLKKKLNLLKEQKKGLMQNLLTGKVRVKV